MHDRIAKTIEEGLHGGGPIEEDPASPTLTATERWLQHRATRSSAIGLVTPEVKDRLSVMATKAEEAFAADLDGFEKSGGFEEEFNYKNTSPRDLVRRRSSLNAH